LENELRELAGGGGVGGSERHEKEKMELKGFLLCGGCGWGFEKGGVSKNQEKTTGQKVLKRKKKVD